MTINMNDCMDFHLLPGTLDIISQATGIPTNKLTTHPFGANIEHKKEYVINNAKNLGTPTGNVYLDLGRILNLQETEKSLKRLRKDLAKSLK